MQHGPNNVAFFGPMLFGRTPAIRSLLKELKSFPKAGVTGSNPVGGIFCSVQGRKVPFPAEF